jgi:hypothetical protein
MRLSFAALAVLAACSPTWGEQMKIAAANEARTTYCPAERVHVRELAVRLLVGEVMPPWTEPVPPPAVASDPARMTLWQRDRDQRYAEWQASRGAPPVLPADADPIYELVGCDRPELWRCGGRRGCRPLREAFDRTVTLACPDGRAAERTGDAFACAARPAVSIASCVSRCPPGDDARECEHACVDEADAECRRDGFDALGLCGN